MQRLFEGSYHSRMRSHVLLAVTLIYVLTALCVGTMSTRQDFVFMGDSDCHVLHELLPLSVVHTVSYDVQLSSPHPGDIMNVIKCSVYLRATTILLHSWSGAASIQGWPLNVVRRLFKQMHVISNEGPN